MENTHPQSLFTFQKVKEEEEAVVVVVEQQQFLLVLLFLLLIVELILLLVRGRRIAEKEVGGLEKITFVSCHRVQTQKRKMLQGCVNL